MTAAPSESASDRYPGRGPVDAVPATPDLAAGSVRRTTSIAISREPGSARGATADIRGRDVRRTAEGEDEVIDELVVTAEIDEHAGELAAIGGGEGLDLSRLIGADVRRGFGRTLVAALPDHAARRSLLFSVLEDLNGALLVSGYAPLRRGLFVISPDHGAVMAAAQQDICAGWAAGEPLVELLRTTGQSAVPMGPDAPRVTDGSGRWHEIETPPLDTVTRIRSLDVGRPGPDGRVVARAHFRDAYAGDDAPMIMHEYLVHAEISGDPPVLDGVVVEPRVLPWDSCPSAAASATRLVGSPVADLPPRVRAELVGTSTCTHLNSTMRSLADVAALLEMMGG